jgi:hypothetical protein
MWKNNVEPDSPQMTIRRMRITCWIPTAKKLTHTHTHTLRLCNTHCFSTAITVARTHLNVRLHVLYIVNYLYTLTFLFVLSQFAINFLSDLGGEFIWHGNQAVGYTTDESALDFRHNLTK